MVSVFAEILDRAGRLSNHVHGGERGQTLVEYGLILALISVTCVGVLASLGFPNLFDVFAAIADAIGSRF